MATIRRTRGDDIDAACGQLVGRVNDRVTTRLGQKLVPASPWCRADDAALAHRLVAAGVLALAALGVPQAGVAAEPGSREAIDQAAAVNTELALAYMREGNLKAAREKIDKALQQNPRTANTQMAAGSSTTSSATRRRPCRTSSRR